uniref:Putative huntingtin n=1 Tax=Ixodes ricinus TaxID=34613 RepID=A0A0K8RJE7_IXORI
MWLWVWTPSLWHLKQRGTSASPQQLVPTHLELSPYLGRTQLSAGARRLPNFLPDSGGPRGDRGRRRGRLRAPAQAPEGARQRRQRGRGPDVAARCPPHVP